jgi:threonine dehydratase
VTTLSETFASAVCPTTIIESQRLSKHLGTRVILASETFQKTGSFKFRAAYHVALSVPHKILIAASSGNFGQALAYACALTGKSCIIVMPLTSARVKVEAVREYGGQVELVNTLLKSRQQRILELSSVYPDAYIASSADDPLVIEGNSSLGAALSRVVQEASVIVAPIGGGGLASGIIVGIRKAGKKISVIGAEPALGNDAARSFRAGRIISNDYEPETIADGARNISIGKHNWKILQNGLETIIEVPEHNIIEAVRLLFIQANLKVEPTGALSLAAVLGVPEMFKHRTVCCVISGGNVDPAVYANILTNQANGNRTHV